jgi:hypothetical protein
MEQTPTLETNCYLRMKPLILASYRFSVYRIRKAPPRIGWRGRPTRERGLNENTSILLVLAQPRKAQPSHIFAQEDMNGRILCAAELLIFPQ